MSNRPEWMIKELDNKKVDEILLSCNSFVTDGSIQSIYEYIQSLEKKQKKSIWEKYRELYSTHRHKLKVKINEYIRRGQQVNYRQGSESLETFIVENSEQEAFIILEEIERELNVKRTGNK